MQNGFLDNNFKLAMAEIDVEKKTPELQFPLTSLISKVMDLNWSPVLVFSFSKLECEQKALKFTDQIFTTGPFQLN